MRRVWDKCNAGFTYCSALVVDKIDLILIMAQCFCRSQFFLHNVVLEAIFSNGAICMFHVLCLLNADLSVFFSVFFSSLLT